MTDATAPRNAKRLRDAIDQLANPMPALCLPETPDSKALEGLVAELDRKTGGGRAR